MIHSNLENGGDPGSFARTFVKSLARAERGFCESRGPSVVATRAAEPEAPRVAAGTKSRGGPRLIDLERRAKFGQYGPTSR